MKRLLFSLIIVFQAQTINADCSSYASLKNAILESNQSSLNRDLKALEITLNSDLMKCSTLECRLNAQLNFQSNRAQAFKESNNFLIQVYSNLADQCL
jgi:hypothetical protein